MSNKPEDTKEINLKLTIDEVNQILEALGSQPFARVFSLIGKIQEEAASQLNGMPQELQPEAKENE